MNEKPNQSKLKPEFDDFADGYDEHHRASVSISGEEPAFFSEYKVADISHYLKNKASVGEILDFGSGIGNSIPHFRKYFPAAKIICSDVSARSMEISKKRFPGNEIYVEISQGIPLQDKSVDLIFAACVFHHINHSHHVRWMSELRRICRPGGILAIYEHNPYNPLTRYAVNRCAFDADADLISARAMRHRALEAGWSDPRMAYKLFFPAAFAFLRPLEKYLSPLFLGAQWRLVAKNNL